MTANLVWTCGFLRARKRERERLPNAPPLERRKVVALAVIMMSSLHLVSYKYDPVILFEPWIAWALITSSTLSHPLPQSDRRGFK